MTMHNPKFMENLQGLNKLKNIPFAHVISLKILFYSLKIETRTIRTKNMRL